MIAAVLDTSVVLKWFRPDEPHGTEARTLRKRMQEGEVVVTVPYLLFLEAVNAAGRRWAWDAERLLELVDGLSNLGFQVSEPPLSGVAAWVAAGLTAYDAAYVALAQEHGVPLITDDRSIVSTAPDIALPLVAGQGGPGVSG